MKENHIDSDKTIRIDGETQIRIAVGRVRELEKELAACRKRVMELEEQLLLFQSDEASLASRCRALERMNFDLLRRLQERAEANKAQDLSSARDPDQE
jgi:cob(I)alamin adenosyltransferase